MPGHQTALDRLMQLVYEWLPVSALINEAYLRLLDDAQSGVRLLLLGVALKWISENSCS